MKQESSIFTRLARGVQRTLERQKLESLKKVILMKMLKLADLQAHIVSPEVLGASWRSAIFSTIFIFFRERALSTDMETEPPLMFICAW